MQIKKKHIVIGAIAIVSISAAILYAQLMKLKNSAIKFGGIKYNGLTNGSLSFDLTLLFNNISKIKLELISQEYKIYLDNNFVSTVSNPNPTTINKLSSSPITVNVLIHNQDIVTALKTNYKDILLNPANVQLRVDSNLKVKVFGLTFNVPYVYSTNIKELTAKKPK